MMWRGVDADKGHRVISVISGEFMSNTGTSSSFLFLGMYYKILHSVKKKRYEFSSGFDSVSAILTSHYRDLTYGAVEI